LGYESWRRGEAQLLAQAERQRQAAYQLPTSSQSGACMPIYSAMNKLKSIIPHSVADAQALLDTLPFDVQEQLISAVYLGREHIHNSNLRDDVDINRSYTDHISKDEYARILCEKGENLIIYLDKLESCAMASGFDLNKL
jgi:hypothetical protein